MILDIDAGNSFVKWRLNGQDGTFTRGSQPTNVVLTQGLDLAAVNRLSVARLSSVANKALAQRFTNNYLISLLSHYRWRGSLLLSMRLPAVIWSRKNSVLIAGSL